VQRDGSSLRRRHEGYLRSDLLAAIFRSNREVGVFVPWRARKNFHVRTPTQRSTAAASHQLHLRRRPHINYVPITYVIMANPFARRTKVGGRPCVRVFTRCPSHARYQGRIDLQVGYVSREVNFPFLFLIYSSLFRSTIDRQ
jgi:hypothetical protein